MSELAPETPNVPAPAKGAAGKLSKKYGPLPLWLWLGIAGGVILLIARRGSGGGGTSGDTPAPTSDPNAATSDPTAVPGPLDLGGGSTVDSGVPVGNVGGVEDPAGNWTAPPEEPVNNPTSANPPRSDPVAPPDPGGEIYWNTPAGLQEQLNTPIPAPLTISTGNRPPVAV